MPMHQGGKRAFVSLSYKLPQQVMVGLAGGFAEGDLAQVSDDSVQLARAHVRSSCSILVGRADSFPDFLATASEAAPAAQLVPERLLPDVHQDGQVVP